MITDQQILIRRVKTSHATKEDQRRITSKPEQRRPTWKRAEVQRTRLKKLIGQKGRVVRQEDHPSGLWSLNKQVAKKKKKEIIKL